MKSAIIYLRVSTDKQEYQRQHNELMAYAEKNNYQVEKVFNEKRSGTTKIYERKEFNNFLAYIEENKIDSLLLWELSRVGRRSIDILNTIQDLTDKGINVFIKSHNLNTLDKNGKKDQNVSIIINMLAAFAENEIFTFKKRVKSGLRQQVSEGGSGSGVLKAYGFNKVGKKLLIDEEEKEIIIKIYNLYLSGKGTTKIAKILNLEKIPTKTEILKKQNPNWKFNTKTFWTDKQILGILKNPIYKGERQYKNEVFKVPIIIDADIWEKVQLMLANNNNRQGINTKFNNPLKGKIFCGSCGSGYYLHKRTSGKDNAYKCLSRHNRYKNILGITNCNSPSVNYDKLLKLLYDVTKQGYNLQDRKLKLNKLEENIKTLQQELALINKDIENNNKALDRLLDIYLSEKINKKNYTDKYNQLTQDNAKFKTKKLTLSKSLEEAQNNYNNTIEYGTPNNAKLRYEDWLLVADKLINNVEVHEVQNKEDYAKESKVKNDTPIQITIDSVFGMGTYIVFRYDSTRLTLIEGTLEYYESPLKKFEERNLNKKFYKAIVEESKK